MLKTLYVKWVLKHCRHLCFLCEFKHEMKCSQAFNSCTWKELFEMKKEGRYYGP